MQELGEQTQQIEWNRRISQIMNMKLPAFVPKTGAAVTTKG